jgi:hypothetical protein
MVRGGTRNIFRFSVLCWLERHCATRLVTNEELQRGTEIALKITPVPKPRDLPDNLPVDRCMKELT